MKAIKEIPDLPEGFPRVITKGSIRVTIYARLNWKTWGSWGRRGENAYVEYTLAYYPADGKRKLETARSEAAIMARAAEVIEDLKQGRAEPATLRATERDEYGRAKEHVKPTGVALDIAAAHFAEAFRIMGSDLVVLAAQDYVKRHRQKLEARTVAEAVDEFVEEKRRAKRSDRHVDTLRSHLDRFSGGFPNTQISTATANGIDLFLDNLKDKDNKTVSTRTRDNYANSIVSLFEWAKRKRYLPSDFDEHTRITRLDNDEDGPIEIYTPNELSSLLNVADTKLVPFLAIGAFAGLRSSEIMRLEWPDIHIDNGSSAIVVQKGKVKKRGKSRRIVPISPNLRAWLEPLAKESGKVMPYSTAYLYEMLAALAVDAKVPWKSNALRHSAISYRVAAVKNVPQIALESGNSPQMIDSSYRELVTDQDAARWFEIMPAPVAPAAKRKKRVSA